MNTDNNKKDLPKLPYGQGSFFYQKDLIGYRKRIKFDDDTFETKTVYAKTTKECMEKMLSYEKTAKKKEFNARNKPLYLAMYDWVEEVKKPMLKSQSYDRLNSIIKNQIEYSKIGHFKYQSITTEELQDLIKELNTQKYSHSTIKKVYDALNAFYKYISVKDKTDNPMSLVVMPREENVITKTKTITWLEEDDINKFIKECDAKWNTGNPKYQGGNAIAANIYLGLRGGELLALQWKDIDFDDNTIFIYKTLIEARRSNKTVFEIQESTKRNNNRYVPINSKARALLLKHKEQSIFTEDDDYVISTRNRKTTTIKNLNDTIKKICENAETTVNPKKVSSHTIRHTCASLYFRKGVQIEIIAKILGHSVEVCRKTYLHFVEEQLKQAASKIDVIEI